MRTMRVIRLVLHARTRQPVLLLGEVGGERCLPVFLRQPQAQVIALGPRAKGDPLLTQDLLVPVVSALGRRLDRVELTSLRDGLFASDLVFDEGTRIAARPSDALCIAVRDGLPIVAAEAILDEVGQPVDQLFPAGSEQTADDQVHQFREFIEKVSPEDFQL
jgi:hypothetical protein